jgi:ComF family protein
MRLFERALEAIFDLLAPPDCAACARACASSAVFCAECAALRSAAPSSAARFFELPLVVAGDYAPPLSPAIQRFKYSGHAELARPLSRLLAPALLALALPRDAILVPVPLHARRLAARGYNQAALLAVELARQLGLRARPRLLERPRYTERQVGKGRDERLHNLEQAFRVRTPCSTNIVLIDDVVTTGATVRACAQALTDAGASVLAVGALAAARAVP